MENLDASRVEAQSPQSGENDILAGLLEGYTFTVCDNDEDAAEALEIRRRVYVEGVGYDVPVPDAYDHRSWLLLARDEKTGKAVGSMRLTPRFAGPFELEEYFTLPKSLRGAKAIEINRFAILPEYRKGTTFLPVVSMGLFKTVMRFARSLEATQLVIASKPKQIWTYEWLRFQRTGRKAMYGALDAIEHELLTFDYRKLAESFAGNPCEAFLTKFDDPQVVLPRRLPDLGLGCDLAAGRYAARRAA